MYALTSASSAAGQHPAGALPDDLVQQRRPISRGAVFVDYGEHEGAFPTDAANVGLAR
jgi:hypothetical protein